MNTTMKTIFGAAIVLCAALYPGKGQAYNLRMCDLAIGLSKEVKWQNPTQPIYIHNPSFPSGSAERKVLDRAIAQWNHNPSNFRYTPQSLPQGVRPALKNRKSEIFYSTGKIMAGTNAVTYTWYTCKWGDRSLVPNILETDVLIESNYSWTTSFKKKESWAYEGEKRPLLGTLTHELGHAAGLLHENRVFNIMGQEWSHVYAKGDEAYNYVGVDEGNGLKQLYGVNPAPIRNLTITNWRHRGAAGEYSSHQMTQNYSKTRDTELNAFWDGVDRVFYLSSFDIGVKATYTIENNGNVPETFYVQEYNPDGSTTKKQRMKLQPGEMRTYSAVFPFNSRYTLPKKQKYYVGVILDVGNKVKEVNEDDNESYTAVMNMF